MKICLIKKNELVITKEYYHNLLNKNEKLNNQIKTFNEKQLEQLKKLDEIEIRWKKFHEDFDKVLYENLSLSAEVADLRAEVETLKKSNKSLKGYATKYKNKFEVIQGRKK